MRLIIYGAGGIGGTIGGHLSRVGKEVIFICRPGHANAINEHGLVFVTPVSTQILRLPAVTHPSQIDFRPDDVILLCMKGQDTDEALQNLQTVTKDVPIFCVQNGVRNEEIASQYFPRVYGVRVRVGAAFLNDGEITVRRDPPGSLITGCYPTGTDDLVEAVAASLREADFYVLVTPDVMPFKWGKLMLNLANAIGAITNARGEDVNLIAQATRKEAQEILTQAGIRWISQEEETQIWPDSAHQPRATLNLEAQSSTWQSLARQRGAVETDFLNGEIVRVAESLGRKAPINETLLRISQEMAIKHEVPGKYTPAELRRLLGMD